MFGLYVPAGTPRDVVALLNREINAALQTETLRARLSALAAQGLLLSPEAFAARNREEFRRMGEVIRATGLAGN